MGPMRRAETGRRSGGGEWRHLQLAPHDLRECRLHVRLVVQLRLHLLEWHVREHAPLDQNLRPLHVLDRRHGRYALDEVHALAC